METKYGEIKSIYDLFEEIELNKYGEGCGGEVLRARWKCKMCGDVVEGYSQKGAGSHSWVNGYAIEHIELHKTLELLNK